MTALIPERLMALGRVLGEFGQDRLHFGVVSGDGPALAQIARGTCQHEVVRRVCSTGRDGDDVIQVVDAAVVVEELKYASLGHFCADGALSAVAADATVSFGDLVADGLGDVAGVRHSYNPSDKGGGVGCVDALQASALILLDRMIDPAQGRPA